MTESLMPVLFLSHGAGPAWLLDGDTVPRFKTCDKNSKSANFLRSLVKKCNIPTPKAILVISAHWEEPVFTVSTNPAPPLYYDYYNFPEEAYNLSWSTPGAPQVALEVKSLLEKHGFECREDNTRGLDHGLFVPLSLLYPEGGIPMCQLALRKDYDLKTHLAVGELLQDLRRDGMLIVGSGYTTHNSTTQNHTPQWCKTFQKLINDVMTNPSFSKEQRIEKLDHLLKTEEYKQAHPTPDHFFPMPVVVAAGGYKYAEMVYEEVINFSWTCSHFLIW